MFNISFDNESDVPGNFGGEGCFDVSEFHDEGELVVVDGSCDERWHVGLVGIGSILSALMLLCLEFISLPFIGLNE